MRRVSPAKVNLGLWVTGKRPDGYHDLLTVFQALDFSDEVVLESAPNGTLDLRVEDGEAPAGPDNLVHRAARLLWKETGDTPGVRILLRKRIPLGAGLGGGSSNAAAALTGLNQLWELGLPEERLADLALELGSDVPFFLRGGTALGRGRGEHLEPLETPGDSWGWILALTGTPVSTAEVFRNLRLEGKPAMTPERLKQALGQGRLSGLAEIENQLESTAARLHPELGRIGEALRAEAPAGSWVSLTGSGGAYVLILPSEGEARAWLGRLAEVGEGADTPLRGVDFRLCFPLPISG